MSCPKLETKAMGVKDYCLKNNVFPLLSGPPKENMVWQRDYMYDHDICSQSYCFLPCGFCDMGTMVLLAFSSSVKEMHPAIWPVVVEAIGALFRSTFWCTQLLGALVANSCKSALPGSVHTNTSGLTTTKERLIRGTTKGRKSYEVAM